MDQSYIRKPVAAGQFYPSSAKEINRMVSLFAGEGGPKKDAIGCVLPHAGYIYSGLVAVQAISKSSFLPLLCLKAFQDAERAKPILLSSSLCTLPSLFAGFFVVLAVPDFP